MNPWDCQVLNVEKFYDLVAPTIRLNIRVLFGYDYRIRFVRNTSSLWMDSILNPV